MSRKQFEAWISAPPFERSVERQGENGSWPGQYRSYETQAAWEAWQEATKIERERCEWADDCATVLLRLKDTLAENGARPTAPEKADLWDAAFAVYERMLRWANPRSNSVVDGIGQ